MVKTKGRRLNITLGAALVASALVVIALIVASAGEKSPPMAPTFTPSIHALGTDTVLALTGYLPEVTVRVRAGDAPATL
jgi:hypothetical protein